MTHLLDWSPKVCYNEVLLYLYLVEDMSRIVVVICTMHIVTS